MSKSTYPQSTPSFLQTSSLTEALYRAQPSTQFTLAYHQPHPAFSHPDDPSSAQYPSITRLPSLLTPGMASDYRNFYSYVPNEVKHRKRTSTAQLKVLESVFKSDTKPNASLRKDLAGKLDMTPRGVQVWFQNRRAKEKTKASKAPSSKNDASASSVDTVASPSSTPDSRDSITNLPSSSSTDLSLRPSSVAPPPPQLDVPLSPSWQNAGLKHDLPVDDASLHATRRGSLPVTVIPSFSPPHADDVDMYGRRSSFDTSLRRLANNPYARVVGSRHSSSAGSIRQTTPISSHHRYTRSRGLSPYGQNHQFGFTGVQQKRASMPPDLISRRSSADARLMFYQADGSSSSSSPSPNAPSPYHSASSLPDNSLYTVVSRTTAYPIPGPLPSPGFSFGMPSASYGMGGERDSSSSDSGDGMMGMNQYRGADEDYEDDSTSGSYDAYSRLGSMASIATSESSIYYSDVSNCAADYDHSRRGSAVSGVSTMMSGLGFSCAPGEEQQQQFVVPMVSDLQSQSGSNGSDVTSKYPSPAPTLSPPHTPEHNVMMGQHSYQATESMVYDMQQHSANSSDEQVHHHSSSSLDVPSLPVPYALYPASSSSSEEYSQPHASTSSLDLPNMQFTSRYQFESAGNNDGDLDLSDVPSVSISSTGHYQAPSSSAFNPFMAEALHNPSGLQHMQLEYPSISDSAPSSAETFSSNFHGGMSASSAESFPSYS